VLTFCLLPLTACRQSAPIPSGAPTITIHQASGAQPAYVDVAGLSSVELSGLRDAHFSAADWQSLLKITVGDTSADSLPPVQGRYAATDSSLTFTPLFPFDPGRSYQVAFDPARLPHPRPIAVVTRVVRLVAIERRPVTTVTAVYPSIDVLPENTLRLYIEFSAPMGNRGALNVVRLLDERGREVPIPFLPVQADFWNTDHTRYTLFFDPGRVKQGILPNEQLGRPLQAGHRYTLEISADWQDAQGQPLVAAYRRPFRVGPADARPLTMASWRIGAPAARTRDPLVVTFPAPLDHGLLARAVGVEDGGGRTIEGDVSLEAADTRWSFRPRSAWSAGEYRLVALPILEDPAGNRIGRAFEVDMTRAGGDPPPDAYRTTLKIVEPGF
jgi:hypothetical protein